MQGVQISLSDDTQKKIDELKEIIGIENRSRILAQGISIYYSLMKSVSKGDNLVIERKNGNREIVNLIIC